MEHTRKNCVNVLTPHAVAGLGFQPGLAENANRAPDAARQRLARPEQCGKVSG
jgi:hypothetical protein